MQINTSVSLHFFWTIWVKDEYPTRGIIVIFKGVIYISYLYNNQNSQYNLSYAEHHYSCNVKKTGEKTQKPKKIGVCRLDKNCSNK